MMPPTEGDDRSPGDALPVLSSVQPPSSERVTVDVLPRRLIDYPLTDEEFRSMHSASLTVPMSFLTLCVGLAGGWGSTLFTQHLKSSTLSVFTGLFGVAVLGTLASLVQTFRAWWTGRKRMERIKSPRPVV